jgi:hypothetical protein
MPNSLQYPLERERELQHRWKRLLQRTVASKDHSAAYLRSAARSGGTVQQPTSQRQFGPTTATATPSPSLPTGTDYRSSGF